MDNDKEFKKWLFKLRIPFKSKVFISFQPDSGFVFTWKMVIKYYERIFFAHDIVVWDNSVNDQT